VRGLGSQLSSTRPHCSTPLRHIRERTRGNRPVGLDNSVKPPPAKNAGQCDVGAERSPESGDQRQRPLRTSSSTPRTDPRAKRWCTR
jgi:hypothetical protein